MYTTTDLTTAAAPTLHVHIRWTIRRDLNDILAIEHASFDRPWTEEQFCSALRQRNQIGMVAEVGETIAGFMIYSMSRHAIRVLDFAVHPAYRRMGVGRQMAAKLAGKLRADRRTRVVVDVDERDMGGCLFWRAAGFRAVNVVRGASGDEYRFVYKYRGGDEE